MVSFESPIAQNFPILLTWPPVWLVFVMLFILMQVKALSEILCDKAISLCQ